MIDEFRREWTGVAAFIRQHVPSRRLRPNELTWLHDEAREVFNLYRGRGASNADAAEMAKSSILITIISGGAVR